MNVATVAVQQESSVRSLFFFLQHFNGDLLAQNMIRRFTDRWVCVRKITFQEHSLSWGLALLKMTEDNKS